MTPHPQKKAPRMHSWITFVYKDFFQHFVNGSLGLSDMEISGLKPEVGTYFLKRKIKINQMSCYYALECRQLADQYSTMTDITLM